MPTRIATAAVALPVLAALVWVGGPLWTALVAAAAALVAMEAAALIRPRAPKSDAVPAAITAVALVVVAHFVARGSLHPVGVPAALVGGAGLACLWALFTGARPAAWLRHAAVAVAVALYTGGLLSYGVLLRDADAGRDWVYLALGVIFAGDTAALFVGSLAGRTKLAPSISPGKTWEGAAAGLAAAVGAGVGLKYVLALDAAAWQVSVLAASAGVAAQFGDLFESKLKRVAGVKDSGWLLPGHGGVLDRLDSIVVAVPVVYYLVVWWIQ